MLSGIYQNRINGRAIVHNVSVNQNVAYKIQNQVLTCCFYALPYASGKKGVLSVARP